MGYAEETTRFFPSYQGTWQKMPDGTVAKPTPFLTFQKTFSFVFSPLMSVAEGVAAKAEARRLDCERWANVEQALFIVSQSPTARSFIDEAHRKNFQIGFLPPDLTARKVRGICDYGERLILVDPDRPLANLVTALDHELAHARLTSFPAFTDGKPLTLESHIARELLQEADAYAMQVQCAYERLVGDRALGIAGAPANQMTYAEGWHELPRIGKLAPFVKAYQEALSSPQSVASGGALRAAAAVFYELPELRSLYEKFVTENFEPACRWQTFRQRVDEPVSTYQQALLWHGQPYLSGVDISDTQRFAVAGVVPPHHQRVATAKGPRYECA